MVSPDFQALAARRADRARQLAERYPASREALQFFAEIASLQQTMAGTIRDAATDSGPAGFLLDALLPALPSVIELVIAKGPGLLREEARLLDERACLDALRAYLAGRDSTSLRSFFARVLLQPAMFGGAFRGQAEPAPPENRAAAGCPDCGHRPQAGCLRPQGDGLALSLVCSLCLAEWAFPRLRCPACGQNEPKKFAFYNAPEFPHVEVQVCESCEAYLKLVNVSKELEAIADIDEMAALPLDVWAQGQGFRKVQPNLAGI